MSDDQTSTTTSTAPRWPLVVVVVVLLPLAVLGSAVLSGAGTLALFADAGFPVQVQPFGLGMVEVLSLAGTLLRIFATGDRLRRDALVAVLVATAVSVVAGWKAYGPAGVLAGVFLVGLVHLAAEAWLELRARPTASSTTADQPAAVEAQNELVSEKAKETPEAEQAPEADVVEVDDQPTAPVDQPSTTPTGPVFGPPTLAELVREADAQPGDRPGERPLARDLQVSRHAIRTARQELAGLTVVSA